MAAPRPVSVAAEVRIRTRELRCLIAMNSVSEVLQPGPGRGGFPLPDGARVKRGQMFCEKALALALL